MPHSDVSRDQDGFDELLIALLTKQPRRMFVSLFLSLVLIAGMASRTSDLRWVLLWLTVATAVMIARIVVQDPSRFASLSSHARLRMTIALVAASGISHGLSLCFFPAMSPFEQAVLSMMLVGLAAGSVATAVGYRPIFLAYILPTLGPLAVLWAINPVLREVGWIQGLMAVLIVLFAIVLNALARDTFRMLRESYEIRLERAALNRELSAALESAEAANRAKTRFLASASHDLRQPMQTLALFAAALSMRPLDARSKNLVQSINEALHDLTSELDALLDVSKLDAGTVKAKPDPLPLQPLLQRIYELFQTAAHEKDLEFTLDCPQDVWVLTDRKLLDRVIRNLVENAIKYTESGAVAIRVARHSDDSPIVSIVDTGCGIAEAEQERIFEEFYQIQNPERDRRRGLGLGLAIVKRLVELLGLQLSLSSAAGRGTRFDLRLPAANIGTAQSHAREEIPSQQYAMRVLVLDDEEGLRLGMRALLEQAGAAVEVAASTEEALEIARSWSFDLVIADFRLRGEDNGLDAIQRLRTLQPALLALLMTGETSPERLRESQETGIPVLHKPVMPQALLKEISKLKRDGSRSTSDEQEGVGSIAR